LGLSVVAYFENMKAKFLNHIGHRKHRVHIAMCLTMSAMSYVVHIFKLTHYWIVG